MTEDNNTIYKIINSLAASRPDAAAVLAGAPEYPDFEGTAYFYAARNGTYVIIAVTGLPQDEECNNGIYAVHIHNGDACSGNGDDPFADAGTHYNPGGCLHPQHAGDLPPLFAGGGAAFSAFFSSRFGINEIIGLPIVVHSGADDFTTQPAGNSGAKIACGIIERF